MLNFYPIPPYTIPSTIIKRVKGTNMYLLIKIKIFPSGLSLPKLICSRGSLLLNFQKNTIVTSKTDSGATTIVIRSTKTENKFIFKESGIAIINDRNKDNKVAFFLVNFVTLNIASTGPSSIEMLVVIAAKKTQMKNNILKIDPKGMDEKIDGNDMNNNAEPEQRSILNANTAGIIANEASIAPMTVLKKTIVRADLGISVELSV